MAPLAKPARKYLMKSISKKGSAYKALRGELKAQDLLIRDLARPAKLSQSAIDQRMAGNVGWRLPEAYAVLDFLMLPADAISKYFPENPWEDCNASI